MIKSLMQVTHLIDSRDIGDVQDYIIDFTCKLNEQEMGGCITLLGEKEDFVKKGRTQRP